MSFNNGIQAFVPKTSNQVYKLLFFLLPLIYFLLYAWYGFDDTDQGFILSLSYRITIGEVPHTDFLYVRPPLTPLLHSLEMMLLPENIEVIGMRFFGYVYLWLSVLFSVLALRNAFDFSKLQVSPWLIGCLGFFVSMHNYPPMNWHTIDGALFTALGAWLFTKGHGRWTWLAAAMVAWGMAPLAKQPFAIVPLVGMVAIIYVYPRQKALRGLAGAVGVGICIFTFLYLIAPGKDFVTEMITQSTGATSAKDIILPGVKMYVWPTVCAIVPFTILWAALRYANVRSSPVIYLITFGFAFFIFYSIHVYLTYKNETFMPPRYRTYHALWGFGTASAIYFLIRNERHMALLITMCAGSWAASISWGYPAPAHYMIPSIFMVLYFLVKEVKAIIPAWYFPTIAMGAFICYFLMYQYPYRETHRSKISFHLGDHFPKLNYIYTHREMYEKYGEIKQLNEIYGDNFTVLPAMPLANYLTNTLPPLQIDWAHDAEIAYEYGLELILNKLEETRPIIFVDKINSFKDAYERKVGRSKSSLTRHVIEEWTKLGDSKYYNIYALD